MLAIRNNVYVFAKRDNGCYKKTVTIYGLTKIEQDGIEEAILELECDFEGAIDNKYCGPLNLNYNYVHPFVFVSELQEMGFVVAECSKEENETIWKLKRNCYNEFWRLKRNCCDKFMILHEKLPKCVTSHLRKGFFLFAFGIICYSLYSFSRSKIFNQVCIQRQMLINGPASLQRNLNSVENLHVSWNEAFIDKNARLK